MTDSISVAGNRPRRTITDAEMRVILTQIRLLLDKLESRDGTSLDPERIAEALQAVRENRVTINPPRQPRVVQIEWNDWSDPNVVPLEALGLRVETYRRIKEMGVTTLGMLLLLPVQGKSHRGLERLSSGRRALLVETLQEKGYTFATSYADVPVALIMSHAIWGWLPWAAEAAAQFVRQHNITTLGDLSNLTVAAIKSKQLPHAEEIFYHKATGRLDPNDAAAVAFVIHNINVLLERYDLPPINT